MSRWFTRFANKAAALAGHHATFVIAVALVVGWAVSGPFFGFGELWQLVINTSTTIITFLMVFLVQNSQNRDTKAIHVKLDEIISSLNEPSDRVLDAEERTEQELDEEIATYRRVPLSAR